MRKALFWIHFVVGLASGVVILIMSLTGVLLAFERQIVPWFDPAVPHSANAPIAVSALLQRTELPGEPASVSVSSDPSEAIAVSLGRQRVLLIDRFTGRVVEASRGVRRFFGAVEGLHRWIALPQAHRELGRSITAVSTCAFLLLIITGPLLWWPLRIAKLRRRLTGRARHFNQHNAIGIWTALPLFLIALTGVVMSYGAPPRRAEPPGRRAAPVKLAEVARYWPIAEKQVEGWQRITMRVPNAASHTISFNIDRGELTIDRATAAVVKWEPASRQSAGRRFRTWSRFTHTGEIAGMPGQLIAAIASAGAVVLAWTGLALAIRRLTR